jgi:hypothetical protein
VPGKLWFCLGACGPQAVEVSPGTNSYFCTELYFQVCLGIGDAGLVPRSLAPNLLQSVQEC